MITKINKPTLLLLPPPRATFYAQPTHLDIGRTVSLIISRIKPYLTRKNALLVGGGSLTLLATAYTAAFFWPRTVTFSYSGSTCFTNPVLMPSLISNNKSPTYSATPSSSFKVAGYPVYSHTTCVTPTQPPKEHISETIPYGTAILKKNIKVSAGAFPSLISEAMLEKPIPTQDPLVLGLSSADNVFDYRLLVNDWSVECQKQGSSLVCDITKLNLPQSTKYDFKLERLFKDAPAGTIFERSLTTVESVNVAASSITPEQTIYDVPSEFTLTLNRPAISIENAQLYLVNGDAKQEVEATVILKDAVVTVRLPQPLVRSASFVFSIEHITAADGGFLASSYSLPFKTSGGPKVLGASIGSYKVSLTGSIVLTFDSPALKSQALENFIKLEAAGNAVAATISASGNTLTIKPSSALPRCTALTLKVLDGLQNTSGISGGSAWQLKSRSICQSVASIGTSAQGRSINAYSFGSGPSKIVFVGTTHGDEKSSTYLLNNWIDYLEANGNIPAHRTVVVIPNLNPDGFAASRRTNSNNVDLNRNFPANNWKSGVTMPDHTYNANGGGSAPLSEPESNALANYILGLNPRLVLTYHAAAGVVIPNDSGDSVALAQTYDQKSNVGFASNSLTGAIFDYDTTGAFEDWLHDKHDIPALLVELWTTSGNEFSKNQAAMLAMIQLP